VKRIPNKTTFINQLLQAQQQKIKEELEKVFLLFYL
jgi:hypothetical protein